MTEITWISCAEQMPPDDIRVILVPVNFPITTTGLKYYLQGGSRFRDYEWTPYTPEKWEELNK